MPDFDYAYIREELPAKNPDLVRQNAFMIQNSDMRMLEILFEAYILFLESDENEHENDSDNESENENIYNPEELEDAVNEEYE